MSKMTASRAGYFARHKNVNEFWFCSNGTAFFTASTAKANARNLKIAGKSDLVDHVTRSDYEAWEAAQNGGTQTEEAQPVVSAGGDAGASEEQEPNSAAPESEDAKGEEQPSSELEAATAELEAAKAAQASLAKNASKAKKDAAAAAVAAAQKKVDELS